MSNRWWVDDGTCRSDYNVRYDSNGGSYVESERVPEGELATRPKDPTKKCYRFDGWYTNASFTGTKYDAGTSSICCEIYCIFFLKSICC